MLVLSPRYTADSRTLRTAAVAAGWGVERLGGWSAPERLRGRDVVLYGEPLFVEVIATRLGPAMLDAPAGWLPNLPEPPRGDRHRRRPDGGPRLGGRRGQQCLGRGRVRM